MSNIVERLRSPATVFYEYAADNGAFLREAADEITRQRAENKKLREQLRGEIESHQTMTKAFENEIKIKMLKESREITRLRADLAAVTEERDALATRLAPVEDEALVEIAADAIRRNKFERTGRLDCFDPSNLTLEELGEGRAAISAIRPHIEAAERERCAKRILETNWVDADPEDIAAAIRSGK